jgi:hypothetical protein
MSKIIAVFLVLIFATPVFARHHCFVRRGKCFTKPVVTKPVVLKPITVIRKVTQVVKDNIKVTNNLFMPPPLAPLVIPDIVADPEPIRRPFTFRNNMPGRQEPIQQAPNAFTDLVKINTGSPFIINNVVNRTTIVKSSGKTTSTVSRTAPQSAPQAAPQARSNGY